MLDGKVVGDMGSGAGKKLVDERVGVGMGLDRGMMVVEGKDGFLPPSTPKTLIRVIEAGFETPNPRNRY